MNLREAQRMRGKPAMTPSEKLRRKPADEAHKQDKAVLFREMAEAGRAKRMAALAGRK